MAFRNPLADKVILLSKGLNGKIEECISKSLLILFVVNSIKTNAQFDINSEEA